MGRYVPEEQTEIWYVAAIADPTAPTAAELNAGVDVRPYMIGDLDLPFEGTTADAADMSSKFNKTVDGDYGGQPGSFTVHKDDVPANDLGYLTFPRGTKGFLVIAMDGTTTPGTWEAGDVVDVNPINVLSRTKTYARNTTARAVVQVSIPDVVQEDVSVAA